MPMDLVIEVDNEPGALARVAKAISDAGVNIAAATCLNADQRAELHILVPHATAAKHALAISQLAITREREVAVVEVDTETGRVELRQLLAVDDDRLQLVGGTPEQVSGPGRRAIRRCQPVWQWLAPRARCPR